MIEEHARWRDRPRVRAGIAIGVFAALLGAGMAKIVFDPESTGTVVVWPSDPDDAVDKADARQAPGGGSYAFLQTQADSDEPVTYDPCRPIHLVVNERTAPDDAAQILRAAVDEVTDATGLTFVVDGLTSDPPQSHDDVRDGDGWRPVQISWSDPDETPELKGRVAGLGGSTWMEHDGHRWYVTGEIMLDGPDLAAIGSDGSVGVLMHELAHVLGLDHVDDDGELLHPSSPRTAWGPGDLAGLSELGQGRCA